HGLLLPPQCSSRVGEVRADPQDDRGQARGEVPGHRRGSAVLMSAVARWDAFLAQIANRHHVVIREAEGVAQAYIEDIHADVAPLSNALMAVRSRLQDLESKIVGTWHAKVDQVVVDEGGDREREFAKGIALQRALDDRREELEPRIFAAIAV